MPSPAKVHILGVRNSTRLVQATAATLNVQQWAAVSPQNELLLVKTSKPPSFPLVNPRPFHQALIVVSDVGQPARKVESAWKHPGSPLWLDQSRLGSPLKTR